MICAVTFSMAVTPMERAQAQDLLGGIIGGIIGGAMSNAATRSTQRAQPQRQAPRQAAAPNPQRQQNRAVQTALNHFGWNVGTADGALGPRSRAG